MGSWAIVSINDADDSEGWSEDFSIGKTEEEEEEVGSLVLLDATDATEDPGEDGFTDFLSFGEGNEDFLSLTCLSIESRPTELVDVDEGLHCDEEEDGEGDGGSLR